MSNLESVFIREFKNVVRVNGVKDIFQVPLPESCKSWEVYSRAQLAIQNIEEDYYSELNRSFCFKLANSEVGKKVIDPATKTFKKNDDGTFTVESYKVPSNCYVVASSKAIGVPFKYKPEETGFDYVDFHLKENGEKEFLYSIPKKYLFKVSSTALALSVKNMRNYSGMGYTTWDTGVIFLHTIPYNPISKYVGTKILKTGCTLDFGEEIKEIVNFWQAENFIPSIVLASTEDGGNLCLKQTAVGYNEFEPLSAVSIGEREMYGTETQEG